MSSNYIFDEPNIQYDLTDKNYCIKKEISYMQNRCKNMFKWGNLPDTIDPRFLELMIQADGYTVFTKVGDKFYNFGGGLGGKPNVYYYPTIATIANPALNFSDTLEIDKNCIVIPNDSKQLGLLPLHAKYATLLVENELSMRCAMINARVESLISASDDKTKASAEKFLTDLIDGKLGVIAESAFLDGIKTNPYSSTSTGIMMQLIETEQYLKASWFNELGLNANYNMKREALNSSESALNDDILEPLVDNMLSERKKACEKINEMYGLDLTVDLDSAWKNNKKELEKAIDSEGDDESEVNNESDTIETDIS